jgi:hypothetical protein
MSSSLAKIRQAQAANVRVTSSVLRVDLTDERTVLDADVLVELGPVDALLLPRNASTVAAQRRSKPRRIFT